MSDPTLWRKKPIEVRALKYNGGISGEVQKFLEGTSYWYNQPYPAEIQGVPQSGLEVRTVDGNVVTIPIGAYIVIDAKGFPYPCDAEIFHNGHEKVDA